MAVIFITGSDTGVGKTHIAGMMAREFAKHGLTQVIKPVETGSPNPSDAARAAGDWAQAYTLIALPEPIAPLSAAKNAGMKLNLQLLLRLYSDLPPAPHRIIEGAGGVAVPLDSEGSDWADFAKAIHPDLAIIVIEDRLGAINQARLAMAYLQQRFQGDIRVWLNAIQRPSPEVSASNRTSLAHLGIQIMDCSEPSLKPPVNDWLPR